MKEKINYILAVFLGSMALLMAVSSVSGQGTAQKIQTHDQNSFVDSFCFGGQVAKMDVSDLVSEYTKRTNEFFNQKIAYIMQNPQEDFPTVDLNAYKGGFCTGTAGGKELNDMGCRSISVCNETKEGNPSPYCVGVTLLGFPAEKYSNYSYQVDTMEQLKYSYFCYMAALDKKRNEIYDSTPQSILAKCDSGSQFADEKICKLKAQVEAEKDPKKKASLQDDLDYELHQKRWWASSYRGALTSLTGSLIDFTDSTVKRVKFIDEEIARAKTALDQTLDAYSQLKTSWQLHVKYMDTFAELVKYRDHLVTIRKQTDAFPFRFIDATSTKCL